MYPTTLPDSLPGQHEAPAAARPAGAITETMEVSAVPLEATLTATRLRELLCYDPNTGIFTRRSLRGGQPAGSVVGTPHGNGYLSARIEGRTRFLHRMAWLYMTGTYPMADVDHRNGDRTDNRWSNLRVGTRGQNMQNQRKARSNNQLGVLGVSPQKGMFKAQIQVGGRNRYIGRYHTVEEAHAAYIAAKRRLHPFGML